MRQNTLPHYLKQTIRFDRREVSGAFGDLGTDLPLLTGLVLAGGMDGGRVFALFGCMQIVTGLMYGIPMPLQPLKAVAALVIVQGVDAPIIAGGALAIGAVMLGLACAGWLDRLAQAIPKPVVRGIQVGLGIKLTTLAVGTYLPSEGPQGLLLAGCCGLVLVALLRKPRFPTAPAILSLGALYAWAVGAPSPAAVPAALGPLTPVVPSWHDIWAGAVLLALPQLPLSLGNSMLATRELVEDWFPQRRFTLRRLGISYGLFNLTAGLLGGAPVCHGSGGLAGHYAFGARTGGSVVLYGVFYLALGAAAAWDVKAVVGLFPLPVLGVILAVEGAAMIGRIRNISARRFDTVLAAAVGLCAAWLPNGFVLGLIGGTLAAAVQARWSAALPSLAESPKP